MFRAIAINLANVVVFALCLFVPAATVRWWRAWVFIGAVVVLRIFTFVSLYRTNPALLSERSKFPLAKEQPVADKLLLPFFMASFAGLIIFISYDNFHLHAMPRPNVIISSIGLLLYVAGWWLATVAMTINGFATMVVRHQTERQHAVIDSGIYGVIRHPMYAGIIPMLVGDCLWLESYAAALLAVIPITLLLIRITVEERFLLRTLPGYDAYTTRVQRRLIPGVW